MPTLIRFCRSTIDIWVVALLGCWTFYWGNTRLYLQHEDALYWATRNEESFRNAWLFPELQRSLSQGLGVWSDPYALILDFPVMLGMLPSGNFSEMIFGGLSIAALYASAKFLALSFDLGLSTSRLAGVILCFAVFLPSPFMWGRTTLYMRHMPFLLSLTAVFVGLVVRGLLPKASHDYRRIGQRWIQWSATSIVLLSLILIAGLFTPVPLLLPAVALAVIGIAVRPARSDLFGLCASLTATVILSSSFLFASTQLYRQSAAGSVHSVGTGVVKYAERPAAVWFFDDLGRTFANYRWMVLSFWFVCTVWCFLQGSNSRKLAIGSTAVFVGALTYSAIYRSELSRGNEFGPSNEYVVLGAYPLLAVLTATAPAALGHFFKSQFFFRSWPSQSLRFWQYMPIACLLMWSAIWTVDNRSLRDLPSNLPPRGSAELRQLANQFSVREDPRFRGRVLLETHGLRHPGSRADVVFPMEFEQVFRHASHYLDIPLLGVYSHLQSESFVAFMSRFFVDGSPFVRNWTIATTSNTRIAALAGVYTILSENSMETITAGVDEGNSVEFLGRSFRRRDLSDVNVGQYSPIRVVVIDGLNAAFDRLEQPSFDPRRDVIVEAELGERLVSASDVVLSVRRDELHVRGRSTGTSLLVLPFEYSACARPVDSPSVRLERVNGLFLGVIFSKSVDTRISFRASLTKASCVTK